ncbi:Cell wall integrity transcriptional regulator like [Actinidia chinensis var. chinensis]|uniref:Cell wall integrity transcriptional regulator like n=1 Tax=Actinidia chinensis var. chinensis TaxID=1590841 RepID=A0A2R6QSG1_ACTCC|nr:Cell wall integrity transcriptional regulator like [Actinidia chinensis var. chinensis]
MASRKRSISYEADVCAAVHKEWDEALCPICMDHPHNSVLLLCSSHDKGCRSYICDTSYRHSNCLDRFKKLREDNRNCPPLPGSPRNQQSTADWDSGSRATTDSIEAHGHNNNQSDNVASVGLPGGSGETGIQDADGHLEVPLEGILGASDSETLWGRPDLEDNNVEASLESKLNLRCPLCRGTVLGWKVLEEARNYLNLKPRSCSHESCSFLGNYRELRRHARSVHPTVRPADIDPSRQRAWQRLEHQREYADIVSAIRAAMPGAIVFGDYIIENGDRVPGERERASSDVNGPLWTTFFLFQMIGSMDPDNEPRARSRIRAGHRRSSGAISRRRFLWGENLLGLQDDNDDDDEEEDNDESFVNLLNATGEDDGSPVPRRRRRLTRSRSDEDQS